MASPTIFLSRDFNYIIDVVIRPRFGNCSISMRKFIITSVLWGFDQKNCFFDERSWFEFNNLGLALGTNLEFYTSVAKELKLKVRKFWRPNSTFVEVTGEKLVGVLRWTNVSEYYCTNMYVLDTFKGNCGGGREAGSRGIVCKDVTKKFMHPRNCCHSNHRYLHQMLLSKTSWFSESRYLFLARSKINHILASLDQSGGKYVG